MDQGMNLDIGELEYNPSARDLSDAKVHHMLSDDLWKPTKKVDIHLRIYVTTALSLQFWIFLFFFSVV